MHCPTLSALAPFDRCVVAQKSLLNNYRLAHGQVSTFSFGEADADIAARTAKKKGASSKPTDVNGKAMLEKDSVPAAKQPPNRPRLEGAAGSSSASADGKAPATGEHAGRRTRQPPGGDSSISLA